MVEVSVICCTYNQQKYICEALDSILSQKTEFDWEILIHDDVSTDGTTGIIRAYEERYPDKIRVIREQENQFSQNIDFFAKMVREEARGKYIAMCEGDDYWLDVEKLQRQWEAMEGHPECDMCACGGDMVSEDGRMFLGEICPLVYDGILDMEHVILGGGMYLITAGLFFRKEMYSRMMEFEKIRSLDYAQQMKGALRGGIVYLARKMVAYRRYADGSWTTTLVNRADKAREQCEQEKEILRTLDNETGFIFHDTIIRRLKSYETSFYDQLVAHRKELINMLNDCHGTRYMWGCGIRGKAFEQFCSEEKIVLDGVCDATNNNVGGRTIYGNPICHSVDVFNKADVILASVTRAYDGLQRMGYLGCLINLQKYMPLA